MTVSFSDLDLTKPQATAILYRRIRDAARSVCGPVDIAIVEERAYWTQCVDESIANAVAKVGNANLTAYYLAKRDRSRSLPRRPPRTQWRLLARAIDPITPIAEHAESPD